MKKENRLLILVTSALLCAVGVLIPMFCPKIMIGPASFTLASHVPIFLAMFISPGAAAAVTLGTTLGFFLAQFQPVVVLRALSHIVFAMAGAFWVKKNRGLLASPGGALLFGAVVSVLHETLEVLVVTYFFFGDQLSAQTYSSGYFISVLLLVGAGGFVHSMIDYFLSLAVWKPVVRTVSFPVSVRQVLQPKAARQQPNAAQRPGV